MATPTLHKVGAFSTSFGTTFTFSANETSFIRGSVLTVYAYNGRPLFEHIYIPDTNKEPSNVHVLPALTAISNERQTPPVYSSTSSYSLNSVVQYNGSMYLCSSFVISAGSPPPDVNSDWKLLARNAVGNLSTLLVDYTDFLHMYGNENQLQFSIRTFTDYDSNLTLCGVSGESNKVSQWALPLPSINIDTIGTSDGTTYHIDTTSCVVSATYNTNLSASLATRIYNPIKTIKFDLLEAVGGDWEVVQTSGNVYDGGVALNTPPTQYYVNYKFNGLVSGKRYVVVATAVTVLDMRTSTPYSNMFACNAQTYQLSNFEVNSDDCNGRIEINSYINDIPGISPVALQDGEIDLSGGGQFDWARWREGFTLSNSWTARFWVYKMNIADQIPSDQFLVRLRRQAAPYGRVEIYAMEDPSDTSKVKLGLYVYPTYQISSTEQYSNPIYIESNSVSRSSITKSRPLCIVVGFDYDSGSYFIKAIP